MKKETYGVIGVAILIILTTVGYYFNEDASTSILSEGEEVVIEEVEVGASVETAEVVTDVSATEEAQVNVVEEVVNEETPAPEVSQPVAEETSVEAPAGTDAETEVPRIEEATEIPELVDSGAIYVDGTYRAQVIYNNPSGVDAVTVELVLVDNRVSGLTLEAGADVEESLAYQNAFGEAVNAEVVGRKIEAAAVGFLNGASLTTIAFNRAVSQIRADALYQPEEEVEEVEQVEEEQPLFETDQEDLL